MNINEFTPFEYGCRVRSPRAFTYTQRSLGLLVVLSLAGCGVVSAVKNAAQKVESNKSTVDAFTGKLQTGGATPFEATYITSGSSPATVVYAARPPRDLLFSDTTASGTSTLDLIANTSGEYSCSAPPPGSPATCQRLDAPSASAENQITSIYTPSHWINFLRGGSLVAGLAGDKVTSSTMSVNGFTLQCIDLVAPGVPGTSTICSTSQGILGYIKVASVSTSFSIKSYTASPADSLFQLPAGAKITSITTPTSVAG